MTDSGKIGVGIVGCGHWGPNYVRNFSDIEDVRSVKCCDTNSARLEKIKHRFPDVATCVSHRELLSDDGITVIVVATPASTHYGIIRECLDAGKDVLAEKPLTLAPEESLALHKLALKTERILMVAHTFLYNAGVRKLKEILDQGLLGQVYYLKAARTHLGLVREDVNVVWDLAPHDVSIFNYLLGQMPVSVMGQGARHLGSNREDVAFIDLLYPGGIPAHIHVSWEDSNKERMVRVVGSKASVVFDDVAILEKVKLYEKGISVAEDCENFGEFQLRLRDGDIISPRLESAEPLRTMCCHLVACVLNRQTPMTDGLAGYDVVRVMSAIDRSIKEKRAVPVE